MSSRVLIQAPMAGVQGWELASAVHNAGGLGSIPCAMLSKEQVLKEVFEFKKATMQENSARIEVNLNFFCHQSPSTNLELEQKFQNKLKKYYDDLNVKDIKKPPPRQPFGEEQMQILDIVRPTNVSFHFGLPSDSFLEKIKNDWKITVLSSATTVEEALFLEQKGCDEIIAQGFEAGGHRGMFLDPVDKLNVASQVGLFALLPQIVDLVKIPVIAAGGICDAKTAHAARVLGATKIQVGSRFLVTPEVQKRIHPLYLSSLLDEKKNRKTVLTNVFTGRPARAIINRLVQEIGPICDDTPGFPTTSDYTFSLRSKGESLGNSDFSNFWAGQNVSKLSRKQQVEDIVEEISNGWANNQYPSRSYL